MYTNSNNQTTLKQNQLPLWIVLLVISRQHYKTNKINKND
jgi:hypothetical protein